MQADGLVFGDIDGSLAALRAGLGALVEQEADVRTVQASMRDTWEEHGSRTAAPTIVQQPGTGTSSIPSIRTGSV